MTEETNVPGEGTPPSTTPEIEGLKSDMKELQEMNQNLGGKNEEMQSRIETLQETLDNALEELALRGGSPIAEPISKEEKPPISTPKKEDTEKTVGIEAEIEKSIREEAEHRTVQERKIAELELRETVRDLEGELKEAKQRFPEANERDILLAIEDMDDISAEKADIMSLAEESHNKNLETTTSLKTKLEEELKVRLKKEGEGGISVPQSPGSSPAPIPPAAPGNAYPGRSSEDSEWGDALSKAKQEGRRV